MSNRKNVPKAIETKVLTKSRRRCCLCVFLKEDGGEQKGQIAHLDGNPSNNDEDNLVFLCLIHHDEYDSRTSQSKGLTKEEVKRYRDRLYRIYAQEGTVEVYEAGAIEVGYNILGPVISLSGTLRAIGEDLFISKIELSLTKFGDNSVSKFSREFPRSENVTIENNSGLFPELPASFMLPISQPRDYDMLFIDTQLHDEIRPVIETVRREWNRISSKAEGFRQFGEMINYPGISIEVQQSLTRSYADFQASNTYRDAHAFLEEHYYWESGKYGLQMQIRTSNPDGEFTKDWQFELTEQDACELRQNAVIILQDICGLRVIDERECDYGFAHVKYQPKV